MSNITHQTAPTQFIEAAGIRFAYRRFGKKEGIPVVFFMHFTGTMDHWDPAITDGIAQNREVILFNNTGISNTSGEVPGTIEEMASDAASFIDALGLNKVDLLSISMGGLVAQQLTLDRPALIHKLILVGTGPKAGEGMQSLTPEAQEIFGRTYEVPEELWLSVMFSPTESSQREGRAFLERCRQRKENRDPQVSDEVAPAQIAALEKYGVITAGRYEYLKKIKQPTLVVNGHTDVIIYTVNSFILQQHLPNAQLILYPDSNHGSLYQFHESFVESANRFLSV